MEEEMIGVNGTGTVHSASARVSQADIDVTGNAYDELARAHGAGQDNDSRGDLKQHIHQSQLSKDSKNILAKMDSDDDGIVTYADAAMYGKRKKEEKKKWKLLFIIAILLLLVTYAVIFGLFLLGFQLTKTLDVDNSDNNNALISSESGEYVSTLQGSIHANISSIWDNGFNIDRVYGFIGNKYFNIHISSIVVNYDSDDDTDYDYSLTMYDNSGKMKLNYFYNNSYALYHTLDNGTTIEYSDYSSTTTSRRRLQTPSATDVVMRVTYPSSTPVAVLPSSYA